VSIVEYGPTTYGSYVYPGWANGIGWAMVGLALIFIPLLALIEYCKAHNFFKVSTDAQPLSPFFMFYSFRFSLPGENG
jgi:hypothetical protein